MKPKVRLRLTFRNEFFHFDKKACPVGAWFECAGTVVTTIVGWKRF